MQSQLHQIHFSLKPVPPFRLDLTVWALRRRPDNIVDRWNGQTYRRVLMLDKDPTELAVTQKGPSDKPEVDIVLTSTHPSLDRKAAARSAVERSLGLKIDLSSFYQLAEHETKLNSLAQRFRGLKPPRFSTMFEALVNGIACQQLTLTLGIVLLNRLVTAYGRPIQIENFRFYAFPTPEDLAVLEPEVFRKLGFSHRKGQAIIELARNIVDQRLDQKSFAAMNDEDALANLCQLRGVGRWTAEYVLLRGLGRLHIFPADDVGGRKRLQEWLKLKSPLDYEGVHSVLAAWKPYEGLVYFHLLMTGLAERGILS